VKEFNARLAAKKVAWSWPTIAAALIQKHHWLIVACDSCGTVIDLDLTFSRAATERFERFVCAQQFWDRAMAEAIAGARRDARRPLIVGVMGSGHIEYGDGVPHQLAALGVDDVATALPWPADTDYPVHDPPIADVLFGVASPP